MSRLNRRAAEQARLQAQSEELGALFAQVSGSHSSSPLTSNKSMRHRTQVWAPAPHNSLPLIKTAPLLEANAGSDTEPSPLECLAPPAPHAYPHKELLTQTLELGEETDAQAEQLRHARARERAQAQAKAKAEAQAEAQAVARARANVRMQTTAQGPVEGEANEDSSDDAGQARGTRRHSDSNGHSLTHTRGHGHSRDKSTSQEHEQGVQIAAEDRRTRIRERAAQRQQRQEQQTRVHKRSEQELRALTTRCTWTPAHSFTQRTRAHSKDRKQCTQHKQHIQHNALARTLMHTRAHTCLHCSHRPLLGAETTSKQRGPRPRPRRAQKMGAGASAAGAGAGAGGVGAENESKKERELRDVPADEELEGEDEEKVYL